MPRISIDVLRVFVGEDGRGGNPLGVVRDGASVAPERRQAVAAALGYSETVFLDAGHHVAIFTPEVELPFAGHPLVGAAWLLGRGDATLTALHPPAGRVGVRRDGQEVLITGRPEWAPPFVQIQLASPAAVDALTGPPAGHDLVAAWAWEDEARGLVRARVFPVALGIGEDEATGANAVVMAAALGRPLLIRQGHASRITAVPLADGGVEIGGYVTLGGGRELDLDDDPGAPVTGSLAAATERTAGGTETGYRNARPKT